MTRSIGRREMLGFAALGTASLLAGRAWAAYPERPIRWIVPYAAGGGTDVIARLVAGAMGRTIGQQLVIENKPGASTNIGADATARSDPDGYTVLTADNGTLVNNKGLFSKLPYDPDRDLQPLGLLARFQLLVTASATSPLRSAKDFLDRAKASPGAVNYGSPGVGSPHHLAVARLSRDAKIALTHVPYRGAGPLVTDLLNGTVETGMVDFAVGGELMKEGRIRPLAVCSASRLPALPDVPTVAEAFGLGGFEAYAWQGLVTAKAVSADIAARLTRALFEAMADEAVLKRMSELGVDPLKGGPADMAALIDSERAIWLPLIKEIGLTLN